MRRRYKRKSQPRAKAIPGAETMVEKKRRMRRERERLDADFRAPRRRGAGEVANGIASGLLRAGAILFLALFAIVFMLFMIGALGFFAAH